MALPNPSMSFTPFDPLPASDLNDLVENIESLADGTGFDTGAITSTKLTEAFARGRFQNLTTNTAPTGLTIQSGFSFIQGAGNNSSAKTITFPTPFTSILAVYVGQMGYTSGSDPTSVTSPTIADGTNIAVIFADTVTLTNFRAYYTMDSSATLSSTLRKCFTWIAIGVV